MISLDLDTKRRKIWALFWIRTYFRVAKVKRVCMIRASSRKGFHIKIFSKFKNFRLKMMLRLILGDDFLRWIWDVKRHKWGLPTDILFTRKRYKGVVYESGKWERIKL